MDNAVRGTKTRSFMTSLYKACIRPLPEYAMQTSPPFFQGIPGGLKTVNSMFQRASYESALHQLHFSLKLVEEALVTLYVCGKQSTAFCNFRVTQPLLPPPALGFAVVLSRFTNSAVTLDVASMHSAFE